MYCWNKLRETMFLMSSHGMVRLSRPLSSIVSSRERKLVVDFKSILKLQL